MDLTIERLDGTQYLFSDYAINVKDFKISSPVAKTITDEIDGRSGYIDMGTTYEGRKMNGSFDMVAKDALDFPLLRNEIFKILDSREAFYLIDSREAGKRWLVKVDGGFTPEQIIAELGKFDVSFISPSAYAESIGTTLDPKTFDAQVWQTGQGQTLDETMYTQTVTSFSIYNAADGVTIDPRIMPLLITFTGASTNLQIANTTTGETWQYTGSTVDGDTLKLDGVRSLKNDVSCFADTNHKLITLSPGWNDFTLTGPSGSFSISFSFRFYTL